MFALRHTDTKELVEVYASENGDGGVKHRLFAGRTGNVWVVRAREIAEYAATHDTEMYNADYETPENPYVGKLEVVELMIK